MMPTYPSYTSPLEAFARGDYCYAARHAGDDRTLRGAALIMIGNTEEGLPLLDGASSPEALYYRAYGLLGHGEVKEAAKEVERCIAKCNRNQALLNKAEKLKNLISRQRIRVLVQANNNPYPRHWQMVHEMKESAQFEIISIGFHAADDIRIEPYETLESVLGKLPKGWAPDFYFCHQVEYNLMPVGIENAPLPIIGFTGDHDLHIHTCYHHLKLLDAIVVACSTDHSEVTRAYGIDSFTFCKVFGVDVDTFKPPIDRKDIDIFFSGMVFHPYHDDKARLIDRLMQLSDKYNVRVFNYRLSDAEYAKYLAESKMTLTYVRRYGQVPSRGLEALRRGAVVLSQEGGEIELFFPEDYGVVPYRADNLEAVAERVLSQWETKYKSAALRGMKKTIETFSLRVCVDRYLKFLALISSGIDIRARKRDNHIGSQLRYPSLLGPGGPVVFTTNPYYIISKSYKMTQTRLEKLLEVQSDAYGFNILGQCYALNYFYNKQYLQINKEKLLIAAMKTLEYGHSRFPSNLALLFNYGRICYHGGYTENAKRAFQDILSLDNYQYDTLDSFYPYDFFPEFFPYRSLIDEVVNSLIKQDDSSRVNLLSIILSGVWYYLGTISYEAGDYGKASNYAEKAISYLPSIPFYHLLAAKALYHGARELYGTGCLEKAVKHLKIVFDISPSMMHPDMTLFISAYQKLGKDENDPEVSPYVERWRRHMKARSAVSAEESRPTLRQKCLRFLLQPLKKRYVKWRKATLGTRRLLPLREEIRLRLKRRKEEKRP